VISEYPGTRAMQIRDEWMVDHAKRIVALWDGSFSGTFNTIRYARKKGKPVTNLWSRWDTDLSSLLN
jgi:uncharacterized phage-like protein YoqJ